MGVEKMSEMEQLQELKRRVNNAVLQMERMDDFGKKITESNIKMRFESITGILLIAQNDIFGMIEEWEKG